MNRPHTRSFHSERARSPRPASHSELRSTQNLSSSQTMKANHELSVPSQHLEEHLKRVQDGIQSMACEMKDLRKKNASLREKLTLMEQSPIKTRSRRQQIESDSEIDDSRIQELETIIEDLKVQSKRQKRRIAELEAAQAKEELQDLHKSSEEPSDEAEMDPLARMRKLLRIFSDLMITNTIASDMTETCHVCLDTLRLKKSSSLECQHILCNVCLQSIVKADQTIQCSECRRVCSRESTKPVIMTEEDRWDRLLNVAQAWDAFDRRGEMETSEEDDENSITAGSGKSEESGENDEINSEDSAARSTGAEGETSRALTPASNIKDNISFFSSPTREKRKRLEQLAEARANKRRK